MVRRNSEELRDLVKSVRDKSFSYDRGRKRRVTGKITIRRR